MKRGDMMDDPDTTSNLLDSLGDNHLYADSVCGGFFLARR